MDYHSVVAAFAPNASPAASTTALNAESRKEFINGAVVAGAAFLAGAAPANAIRDYENIAYLGGSKTIDINNANIRVYLKRPGMYLALSCRSNIKYVCTGI